MATLPTRILSSFQANIPVSSLNDLDDEFNQLVGAAGILNGGTTGTKLLVKSSDASDPPIEIDQIGAGPLAEWKQNGTLKVSLANSGQIVSAVATGTAPLSVASTTKVDNLNADLLDGISSAGFALSTAKTAFSTTFFVPDPTLLPTDDPETGIPLFIVPDGQSITITKVKISWRVGSHTAGSSLQFTMFLRTAASSWASGSTFGSVSLSDGASTANFVHENSSVNQALAQGDTVECFLDSISGTVTERQISIAMIGTQQVF